MSNMETAIHLCAGGVGGTMGAIVTCPLEVIKTRLQSSTTLYRRNSHIHSLRHSSIFYSPDMHWNLNYHQHCPIYSTRLVILQESSLPWTATHPKGMLSCFRHIVEQEGPRALFKGLGANIVGVAPTRAIYFCTYSTAKRKFNQILKPDSHIVHMCSAGTAGFVACTLTNPIWFVKTRIQLARNKKVTARQCITNIYRQQGVLGFYKGISASYFGISETIINFVLYEYLKATFQRHLNQRGETSPQDSDPNNPIGNQALVFMMAGAISKTVACCLAYPHEVARTRLREENSRYHGFFQTLTKVFQEEGYRGLYRGLGTQLVRQIPNMAIMMTTFEVTVYLLNNLIVGDGRVERPISRSTDYDQSNNDS